ncbi:FtsX-like permease family protein [Spirosoma sp. HMF4905]|uniref:FtsX-like permease family protein n=2 Tax=Spirosoma arboris TaxID=2682092 RepID=A0A7K1SJ15_9BACT|nr:FtsX-like permease family protein [Spirosoma arboris]
MLRNYFTVAQRTLMRQKSYSLINILGLALGMSCGILIFMFVNYHLSFDTFQPDADRLYRVIAEMPKDQDNQIGSVPAPLGQALQQDYPFFDKVARVVGFGGLISLPASKENKKFQEAHGVAYAEAAFLELMDFSLVAGSKKNLLKEPNTAVITQNLATKYFGRQEPIGQLIRLDNKTNFRITGILKNLPVNTDRREEIYLSYVTLKETNPWLDTWGGIYGGMNCFLKLKAGESAANVEKALTSLNKKYYSAKEAGNFRFKLQPLADIHVNPKLGGFITKNQLLTLSLIGLFLLVTACINFINLATAQAVSRSKEIGVRKVLGSLRIQLFRQFITETALIASIAAVIALGVAYLALPYLNQLVQTRLTLNLLSDYRLLTFLPALVVLVTFISGSYPGLIISGFQPILALKGKLSVKQAGGFSVRRVLVVTQFAISQTLIIGTIVVMSQMRYNSQADMGFNKDAIVMLPVPEHSSAQVSTLSARLSQVAGVKKAAFCNAAPASPENNFDTGIQYDSRPEPEKFTIYYKAGDPNYVATFGLTLIAGRNLYPSDTTREYLLNETAVKKLGIRNPRQILGKTASINGQTGTIVGVLKDFHNKSFRRSIDAVCLTTSVSNYVNCAIKVNPKDLPNTLASIEKIWSEMYPANVYSYQFLDDQIARFYETDKLILQLIELFAGIAIFISCLGLYGLISFMATQKIKEIGVRKTLGANSGQIIWLFGKEFTQLLVFAFAIAAPLGWWAMNRYLEDFQYRIKLSAGIFLLAISVTFIIAILTVGYRSVKAALMNPVTALRSE